MEQEFKLNNKIYALLVNCQLDDFTVNELCGKFHQLGFSSASASKDRQFLYRQLFALEDKQLLLKEGTSYSREIRYKKTPLFNSAIISPKSPDAPIVGSPVSTFRLPSVSELKERLVEYQIKFISSLGESEEYQKMLSQFPEMAIHIQDQYQQCRENSTRYLGKINAINKIIQSYGQ